MKVERLDLERFTAFEKAQFEFSPSINVLIGENATGKSHILKLLYTMVKTAREIRQPEHSPQRLGDALRNRLEDVFLPSHVGRLVTRKKGRNKATVRMQMDLGTFDFTLSTLGNVTARTNIIVSEPCIFLPPREMLSTFPGFVAAYEDQKLKFDATYRDLCVALSAAPLRGPREQTAAELVKPLENLLGGRVVLEGDHFELKSISGSLEAPLLAEGIRKLASIQHLIVNGSLLGQSILFWDEPEANLNPKLSRLICDVLVALSFAGLQVFVATHDYHMAQTLSLASEYPHFGKDLSVRFFSLYRRREKRKDGDASFGPVLVENGRSMSEIENDAILESFAELENLENRLALGS